MFIGRGEGSSHARKFENAGERELMKKRDRSILTGEGQEFPQSSWPLAVWARSRDTCSLRQERKGRWGWRVPLKWERRRAAARV